ncbi:hypothetical protein BDV41DRAFT_588781 [Aspergillus transmontanensis]|uniref:FAD-binding domain-containing protein n=1 Tax=Aspergillus transmontanensis TaxID=1034304 RepID=A0A5N6VVU2_9EURO|nr:hypothetical protein BDV41DRAFT_588781 [Aspergillus transmontanensis]
MPLPHFKVIIVGASIEDITLPYCLHRAGINYRILEKRNQHVPPREEPLIIMPNGARIWNQLGLLDLMTDFTVLIETAYMTLPDTGSHGIGFPKVLRERFGYSPAFMKIGASCMRVVTWSGYEYEGDLVVGADGMHSKVRGEMARLSKLEELTMDVNNDMTVEYVRITGVSTRCLDYPALTHSTMLTSNGAGQNITCLAGNNAEILWSVFLKLDRKRQRCESAELFNQMLCTGLNWRDMWDRRKSVSMIPMEEGLRGRWHWRDITSPHTGQDTSCSIEDAAELAILLYGCLRGRHTKPLTEEINILLGTFMQRRIRHAAGGVSVKFIPLPGRSELAWSDLQLEQHTYWYGPLLMMMLVGVVLVLLGFNVVPGLHYTRWL